MTTEKPREFWMDGYTAHKHSFVTSLTKSRNDDFIHLIEYSAYDALQAKADKLAEALEAIAPHLGDGKNTPYFLHQALKDFRGEDSPK